MQELAVYGLNVLSTVNMNRLGMDTREARRKMQPSSITLFRKTRGTLRLEKKAIHWRLLT